MINITEQRPKASQAEMDAWLESPTLRACICRNLTIKELIEYKKESGEDTEAVLLKSKVGTGCGACLPFIRVALNMGWEEVPLEVSVVEKAAWVKEPFQGLPEKNLTETGLIASKANLP